MKPIDIESLSGANQERLREAQVDTPVYYVGRQWAVTAYGIEHLRSHERENPYYHIAAHQIDQDVGEGGWSAHMANKSWVDVGDFNRAFEIAKEVHQ